MTTMKDLIGDTRRMAYGSLNDQINLIAAPAAAGARTITMQYDISGISYGMTLSSGLNVWYVTNVDPTTNSVMVIPGYDNSPQKAVAEDDFVFIKPRVTDWYMFETMNQEILRLSTPEHGLYKIGSWTAAVDPTYQTYVVPAEALDMIGMLRIRYRMPGTTDVWYDIPERAYKIQTGVDATLIRLLRNIPSGTDVEFLYKGPFHQATDLTDDVIDVCGLAPTMVDIPTLGCLATLLRTTESRRNQVQQQGDARRANEVSGGYNMQIAQMVEKDHQMRIWEEAARLIQRVPLMRGN